MMTKTKTALVTGGARRIGRAIVMMLAKSGWNVAIHYNQSKSEAEELASKARLFGGKICVLGCNLAEFDETNQLPERCAKKIGPISLLVNNASHFQFDSLNSLKKNLWDETLAINLRAPIQLARGFANQLPDEETGCIINITDQKIFNINPDFFSYTISKQALSEATKTLALCLAPKVRVCAIAPGITLISGDQTQENFEKSHTKTILGKSSEVSDIVEAVSYLMSSKAITGVTITVDGGQHLFSTKRDVQFEYP